MYHFLRFESLSFLPVRVVPYSGKLLSVMIPSLPLEARWLLIEWCCDSRSELAAWFQLNGQMAMRMALPFNDVNEIEVVRRAFDLAVYCLRQGMKVFVWFSFPCTPWSSWQYICLGQADDVQRQKTYDSRKMSRQMVQNGISFLVDMMSLAPDRVFAAFEWPDRCIGWREDLAEPLVQLLPLEVRVSACAFGLRSRKGKLLGKVWRIRSNFKPVIDLMFVHTITSMRRSVEKLPNRVPSTLQSLRQRLDGPFVVLLR